MHLHERIGSTQDVAMRLIEAGAPTGTLVLAEEQTAGRGRQGRRWHAPPGTAILISVVLRPDPPESAGRVTMMGAVAAAHTLRRWFDNDEVRLKWPNDVLLRGRKVAGVLAEASYSGGTLEGVALGIGINVDVDFSDMPDLAESATSVNAEAKTPVKRLDLLIELVRNLTKWQAMLSTDSLFRAWREMLETPGKHVLAEAPGGEIIEGTAIDVDADGALLVRKSDGEITRLLAGEVTLRGHRR